MKKPPEDIATKLLEAVETLPDNEGMDISIDEMARLTDIPRATLYYYFAGKDDLVGFFLNDKLERTAVAIDKAVAAEGSVAERLEGVLTATLHALAEHPRMCVELPAIVKDMKDFDSVMANAERWMLAPLRELLIEGRATGELIVEDVDTAAVALMGALNMVGMMRIVTTGSMDADAISAALVPQLVNGLRPR